MKTVFMGSDAIALPMLQHLLANHPGGVELTAVVTQPDRRTGRGMRLKANAIKQWAVAEGLEVLQPDRCGQELADYLTDNHVELVLVMAYGKLLPRSLLDACPGKVLNLHASMLPRLRGASPIHTAVALGLPQTGVSLMRIVPKLDAGPVAAVECVSIDKSDTSGSVLDKLAQSCVGLMDRALPQLVDDRLVFEEQDPEQVTYCRIIDKRDAFLDFGGTAAELVNRVRAFQPWPGTTFPFDGQEIRIVSADITDVSEGREPGTLFKHADGSLCIACGEGAIRLLVLQRSGGKPLPTDAFLRGFPLPQGALIESREMKPLESPKPFPYRKKAKS